METDQEIRDRRQREFDCSRILGAPTDMSAVLPWWLIKIEDQKTRIKSLSRVNNMFYTELIESEEQIKQLESLLGDATKTLMTCIDNQKLEQASRMAMDWFKRYSADEPVQEEIPAADMYTILWQLLGD